MVFSRISKNSTYSEDNTQRGWIWGKWYTGYIHEDATNKGAEKNLSIYILCKTSFYNNLIDQTSKLFNDESKYVDEENTNTNKIKFYERSGNYCWLHYNSRDLSVDTFIARPKQQNIIDSIIDDFKKTNKVVAIISGNPGSGKSMIPILIAKQTKGILCDSYNPTDPGDDISLIYNTVMPTNTKPLVLVIEEFDILIHRIHNNLITPHKNIPIQVKDKTSWNTLFDRIDRGLFPNIYFILTTNIDPKIIDNLDSSYLRSGRITHRFVI